MNVEVSERKKRKKGKKQPSLLRSLRHKTWELCKQIIRKKYGNSCFTCPKTGLVGSGWQTGHFIPRSIGGLSLRYDLKNLRPQCYNCNVNLGGNGAEFYRRMVEAEGQEYVDELFARKGVITKETPDFYFDLISEYKAVLASI